MDACSSGLFFLTKTKGSKGAGVYHQQNGEWVLFSQGGAAPTQSKAPAPLSVVGSLGMRAGTSTLASTKLATIKQGAPLWYETVTVGNAAEISTQLYCVSNWQIITFALFRDNECIRMWPHYALDQPMLIDLRHVDVFSGEATYSMRMGGAYGGSWWINRIQDWAQGEAIPPLNRSTYTLKEF